MLKLIYFVKLLLLYEAVFLILGWLHIIKKKKKYTECYGRIVVLRIPNPCKHRSLAMRSHEENLLNIVEYISIHLFIASTFYTQIATRQATTPLWWKRKENKKDKELIAHSLQRGSKNHVIIRQEWRFSTRWFSFVFLCSAFFFTTSSLGR